MYPLLAGYCVYTLLYKSHKVGGLVGWRPCMFGCLHVCICVFVYVCVCVHVCTCVRVWECVFVHVRVCARQVYVCVCMRVHVHVRVWRGWGGIKG